MAKRIDIDKMAGKSWMFSGRQFTVSDVRKQSNGMIEIMIEGERSIITNANEINDSFQPVLHPAHLQEQNDMSKSVANSFNTMDKLSDILLNTIEKVENDPSYVSQATTINNSVKQIIDIGRAKIDAMRLVKEMNS
jgi:cell fate regulator YaaT (PSP1 superfamily)